MKKNSFIKIIVLILLFFVFIGILKQFDNNQQRNISFLFNEGNKTLKIKCLKIDEDKYFIYCQNPNGTESGYNKRYIIKILGEKE
jgi:YbbR domain-containing protein